VIQKITPGGGGVPPSHPILRIAIANQNIVAMKMSNAARAYGDGVGCRKRMSGLYGDKSDKGLFSPSSVWSVVDKRWYLVADIEMSMRIVSGS